MLQTSAILVTGTLALAHPKARNALKKAVQVAREGNTKVSTVLALPAAKHAKAVEKDTSLQIQLNVTCPGPILLPRIMSPSM